MKKHYVMFISPGAFVSEVTEKPIKEWDPVVATLWAASVTERHGAKPYGFKFLTKIVRDDIDDGEGGKLEVIPKTIKESGIYHIKGKVLSFDDIEVTEENKTLRFNMECNNIPFVVETTNSYRSTVPFEEGDFVVDEKGIIVAQGNDKQFVLYREEFKKRMDKKRAR